MKQLEGVPAFPAAAATSKAIRIVLLGAGHAHLHVAAHARQLIALGADVTLIDSDRFWYSGMATGVLGGSYTAQDDQIDPQPLIENNGGTFIRECAVSVDRAAATLQLAGGATIGFDLLSCNVGSVIDAGLVEGAERAWGVKPICNLSRLHQHLQQQFPLRRNTSIVVIGGGATGCEVAANIAALARRCQANAAVTIVTTGAGLLAPQPTAAGRALARHLVQRRITIRTRSAITRIDVDSVHTAAGERLPCTVAVLATGLRAPAIIGSLQLPVDARGSLRVGADLTAAGDRRIFATGDCAALTGYDLPKLGVFGVRQAPILLANLAATLRGAALHPYKPQTRYLSILNLGDGTAFSLWGPLYWRSAWGLRLKDRIDRRFMDRYRTRTDEQTTDTQTTDSGIPATVK